MDNLRNYFFAHFDRRFSPNAIKVAITIGSLLFVINHGEAVLKGQMNRSRWISGLITYVMPYLVNIHGQYFGGHKT